MADLAGNNKKATPMLSKDFFDFLKTQMSMVMGHIAEVLIEDELKAMGEGPAEISIIRAAELVVFLSRQITREEKKVKFLQVLINKINESNS